MPPKKAAGKAVGAGQSKGEARKGARTQGDYLEQRKATRGLDRLAIDDSDSEAEDDGAIDDEDYVDKNTSTMPPPTRRSSGRGRQRGPTRQASTRSRTQDAPPATAQDTPTVIHGIPVNLPPGVTPEMVKANLARMKKSYEPLPPFDEKSSERLPPLDVDGKCLPCELSVFSNRQQYTRGIFFNFGHLVDIQTIRELIEEHFAYEFKRVKISTKVSFGGIHVVWEKSANCNDTSRYGIVVSDREYQQIYNEIIGGKTTTGQLVRVQVSLFSYEQLAKDQVRFKDWFVKGGEDPVYDIDGPTWLQEVKEAGIYADARNFERRPGETEVMTMPAYKFRENIEKARLGEAYRDNFGAAVSAQAAIRNQEYDLRKKLIHEIRGLRQIIRKEGIRDLRDIDIEAAAEESEEHEELGGRAKYGGQKDDWKHLMELTKEVEDKSDAIHAAEGGVFDRAFLNI